MDIALDMLMAMRYTNLRFIIIIIIIIIFSELIPAAYGSEHRCR